MTRTQSDLLRALPAAVRAMLLQHMAAAASPCEVLLKAASVSMPELWGARSCLRAHRGTSVRAQPRSGAGIRANDAA